MASHRIVDSKNAVSKNACPHPFQVKQPPKSIRFNVLKYTWPQINRTRILWIITTLVGLMIILLVWIFPPYTVHLVDESYLPNGHSTSQHSYPVSIFWSWGSLLIYLAIPIGLSSGFFIRLYEEKTIQHRLITGALLGGFLSCAILLDMILLQFRPILHITRIYHYQTGTVIYYELTSQTMAIPLWWIKQVLLTKLVMLVVIVPSTALLTLISSLFSDGVYYYYSGRGWWARTSPIGYGGTILFRKAGYLNSYAQHVKHPELAHELQEKLKRELIWFRHPGVG